MENQQLETLHARNQELKKDLGNAKRLVSKIWDKHPEARGTIEEGTGAWLVFGQDVETGGVSAQRITQQAHSTEREAFEKWAASDFSGINLARDGDDYSFVPAKEWWLAWQARAALDADHITQPRKMVAAQEPFGYFKAEPFGWRDCAETDEGAIALYEAPQPQADARDNLLAALENLLASITGGQKQCGHDFDCVCPKGQARAAIAAAKEI